MNVSCRVCGQSEKLIIDTNDHSITKEPFSISLCKRCGFGVTLKVPGSESIGRYYQSEVYISHSDTKKGWISLLYHIIRNVMLERKYKLILKFTKGKKLLDVGSGTGYFGGFMKSKGYLVHGVEIDANAAKLSKEKFGISPMLPDEFLCSDEDANYDVITLWHVMEHLSDLQSWWTKLYNSLNHNGVLIIAIPNHSSYDAEYYDSYWAGYDVPRHMWHWTPFSFGIMANRHFFEIIYMEDMPFDPFYNSLLSEKYMKRTMGQLRAFFIGLRALLHGKRNVEKSSSVIYVLKKQPI